MIICPNCKHHELDGAIFCSECGAQLISRSEFETHRISTTERKEKIQTSTAPYKPIPKDIPDSWLSLHLVDSGQIIPLEGRDEYTIGRSAEGQPIMPDVDLASFNAYASGVSRLHAVLKRIKDHAVLRDLGSANGTYLNGSRLTPHEEVTLVHGDIIYLGKMKIQILLGKGS